LIFTQICLKNFALGDAAVSPAPTSLYSKYTNLMAGNFDESIDWRAIRTNQTIEW